MHICQAQVDVEIAAGEIETVELKPGGADVEVTAANRLQYVELYTQVGQSRASVGSTCRTRCGSICMGKCVGSIMGLVAMVGGSVRPSLIRSPYSHGCLVDHRPPPDTRKLGRQLVFVAAGARFPHFLCTQRTPHATCYVPSHIPHAQHLLTKSIERQFTAFRKGFLRMCNGTALSWFR